MYAFKFKMEFESSDVHISYLPMPHIFERAVFNTLICKGMRAGVFSGDKKKLFEDIAILKPTFFLSVPRLFNKIYDLMRLKISSLPYLKRVLVENAIKAKIFKLRHFGKLESWFYDKVVFNKMKMILGGRVRFMMTASAPIDKDVLDFLKIVFGCNIVEAYGQTEGIGMEFGTNFDDPLCSGNVGGPSINNEFKLVDVPHLDYFTTDKDEKGNPRPRGEIWVRGPNIIPGYFKKEEKNKENFTDDGWLKRVEILECSLFPKELFK